MHSSLHRLEGNSCRVAVAGKVFAIGGLGVGGQALSSIEVYTASNNSWTTFAQMPSGRSDLGCAASGQNIIVAGGMILH